MKNYEALLGVVVIASLIILATKELANVSDSRFAVNLSKSLNIPRIIVVALFVAMIILGIMEILGLLPYDSIEF